MTGRVELAVGSRASARVQPACACGCRSRPMLAGPRPAKTVSSWVVVLHVLGRHPLLSYTSLKLPRFGVVGRQDGVPRVIVSSVLFTRTHDTIDLSDV